MVRRFYRALLEDHDGGIGVCFPDFPGCVSHGDNTQHAAEMGCEALSLHTAGMLEDGDELPEPGELGSPLPDWLAEICAEEGVVFRETLLPVELDIPAAAGPNEERR
jgi:predicted RNase H-like HicB family nuclease